MNFFFFLIGCGKAEIYFLQPSCLGFGNIQKCFAMWEIKICKYKIAYLKTKKSNKTHISSINGSVQEAKIDIYLLRSKGLEKDTSMQRVFLINQCGQRHLFRLIVKQQNRKQPSSQEYALANKLGWREKLMAFQEYVLLSFFPHLPFTVFVIKSASAYKQVFIFRGFLGLAQLFVVSRCGFDVAFCFNCISVKLIAIMIHFIDITPVSRGILL